ncbi:MAG: hypothetical protein UZ21_OP11001000881 [Microgenomates bacterium OLB22]|nr:MAG: hypothetical protein UZ21_OP11001000881 [Microgenomates bacterium OLB22]
MNPYTIVRNNQLKTYFILALFAALFSAVFYAMGQYYGNPNGFFLLGFLISVGTSVSSYFWSDKLVLGMTGAKPADKKDYFDLYTVTENLALAAGLPMPKLYVIQDDMPNAFATGRDAKHAVVAATTGLLQRLDRSDIEGVIAHELSHIKHKDMLLSTILAVLVGALVYAIDFLSRSMMWGGRRDEDNKGSALWGVLMIILIIVTPLLASLIQMAVSRKREYMADAGGVLLTRNPDGLADALEKIAAYPQPMQHGSNATAHLFFANPFKTDASQKAARWMANLFSTHPPIEERVRILRSM